MSEPRQGSLPTSDASREVPPRSFWGDVRAALGIVFRSPLALPLLSGLTFVTVLLLGPGSGIQLLAYLHPSRAQLWRMLIALGGTAWFTCLFVVFGDFERNRSAWPRTRSGRLAVLLCLPLIVLLTALPLAAQYLAQREDPRLFAAILPLDTYFLPKSLVIDLLGVLIGALNTSAMVGVHLQLLGRLPRYQYFGEPLGAKSLDEDVRWYQLRQALLRRFLRLTSAILGVSILSVGALRHLVNATLPASAEPLPIEPVVNYGLYYTGLLACLYLPASNTLKEVGQLLAERLAWQSLGAHPTWKQRFEEQQAIRDHLGLQGSALDDLQQGLAVLAPFLASISSLALGNGG